MTMTYSPINALDAYKFDHRRQYPDGTTNVYSNFTPRTSRVKGVNKVVFFGLQAFLRDYCVDQFNEWFKLDEDKVCADYERLTTAVLGPNDIGTDHIRALHRLGYLPLRFCALPEGTVVPLRVPMFTLENTLPEFFWLVNYIESVLSANIWLPCTSATSAHHLRTLLDAKADETGCDRAAVDFQGHDFSFRGMENMAAAAASGAGHLLSFTGTDSIPSLEFIDYYYPGDNGFVGGSVPATEHSVMCAGGELSESETFDHLMNLYPGGILSVVSDTWDLWKVLTEILPAKKDAIMARDGKLVIRPDSGDPVDIICGTSSYHPAQAMASDDVRTPAEKGVAELLWDTFGGTVNEAGFKELDSHIGMIYGDSINYDRADEMTRRLAEKGFASTNIVLGVGSFTYQFVTRDTFGFAMKATSAVVNGEQRNLFKDPATDNGGKKSATGRLAVVESYGAHGGSWLELIERATPEQEAKSLLQPVWEDGKFIRTQTFAEVRQTLREQ